MHMTSVEKGLSEVSNFVKKLEGITQAGQAKILAKKSMNIGNLSRSYSKCHDQ